jgi:hypothetical protein
MRRKYIIKKGKKVMLAQTERSPASSLLQFRHVSMTRTEIIYCILTQPGLRFLRFLLMQTVLENSE